MTILIVGKEEDLTSIVIKEKVAYRGIPAYYLDTRQFPYKTRLSFNIESPTEGVFQEAPHQPVVPLGDIRGVFRRWSDGVVVPADETDPLRRRLVQRNLESAINTFFNLLDCQWVNTAEATDRHRQKGVLLKELKQAGIRVPETLISNHPEEVKAFYEQLNGQAIFKPVFSWASTEALMPEHLTDESLARLSNMPITVQELINGTDLRIYVVGQEVFAMEIRSETLDFRDDPGATRVAIKLPMDIEARCIEITRRLGLVFCGIDMRRTPDGEYVFFEGNPTPVFLMDEDMTGYPIGDRIVDLLTQGER
ncbi:MAG: hypothetical protein SFZ03_02720 [Candidatus Melainabacteria bacterium]|nr:hypothetical protein [Candidatus Melainabacteria bacterium]